MAKLRSTQIGYFAQEVSRIYSKIKSRELTQTEKDLFEQLGFALVLDYNIEWDFNKTKSILDELCKERKLQKVKELEEQLMKLKEVAK